MNRVSILIPTYNQAEYLYQAVQSALEQDYDSCQVIVSDDASTDSTQDVLKLFSPGDSLIVSRNEVNMGRVANYRKCLYELARGDWVLILDGDDYLCDRSYVSKAIATATQDLGIELVFANAVRFREDRDGGYQKAVENVGLPRIMEGVELFLRLGRERISLFHNTCLYKRQKALGLDFYRYPIASSDWESLHRYILSGKVAYLDEQVAVWRIHGDNFTRTMSAQDRSKNLKWISGPYQEAKARELFPAEVIESWFEQLVFRRANSDLRKILRAGDIPGYRLYMKELRQIHPGVYWRLRIQPKMVWKRFKKLFLTKSLSGRK